MSADAAGLFGLDLPAPILAAARKVEALAKKPIDAKKVKKAGDVAEVVGCINDDGIPEITAFKSKPSVERVSLEVLRLQLRNRTPERRMPYAEMRHESNRRLCTWLYRVIEQEMLLAQAQSFGISVRPLLRRNLEDTVLEPLQNGGYRKGEAEPGRSRAGALDALELLVSYVDPQQAHQAMATVAKLDESIAAKLGLLYTVVENNRPFEDQRRIRAAYYLAVPFLFDTRKQASASRRF
ncbi:MAG: hypothetical protein ACYS22_01740 [Planctomycetota bacterium]|jgi:hypothetical protein